jgi:molybdate transport system ATP-binding protein
MKIENFRHPDLKISTFCTAPGESWCLFGNNNSGIDTFFALLAGELENPEVDLLLPAVNPAILSFRKQQEIYEEELRLDDSDYLNRPDPGTPARAFLPAGCDQSPLVRDLAMTDSLDKGYRQLSSGQSRKLILLREILNGRTEILLENPYDGLDEASCRELDKAMATLRDHGAQMLVTVNNRSDIPHWCSHLAVLSEGLIQLQGKRQIVLRDLEDFHAAAKGLFHPDMPKAAKWPSSDTGQTELISLRQGFAGFGETLLFHHLDLLVNEGDHTLITGPNGSGKSTLLHIITGDNPKCYANDLRIFGIRRGSGESIWQLKRHMGIVSPEIHRNHHIPGTALQVVLSGLFDSIGLYSHVTAHQKALAGQWLDWIGLKDKASQPFRRLSYSRQRLILIARALIKLPRLLILDEPTQGLDDVNREGLLEFLTSIAEHRISTILYVSHRKDEHLPLFRQHIMLETFKPSNAPSASAEDTGLPSPVPM